MKRILALWAIGFLLMAQPSLAVVCVGFGITEQAATPIFSDDFNRADSATVGGSWDSETDVPGTLSISSNRLMWTDASSTTVYVSKALGNNYAKGEIVFDINMSTLTIPINRNLAVAVARNSTANCFLVMLGQAGTTVNALRVGWANESGTVTYVNISYTFTANTTYTVKLSYGAASGVGLSDGYYTLYVNGSSISSSTSLNNYGKAPDNIRFGPSIMNNYGSDVNQDIYFDNFAIYDKS